MESIATLGVPWAKAHPVLSALIVLLIVVPSLLIYVIKRWQDIRNVNHAIKSTKLNRLLNLVGQDMASIPPLIVEIAFNEYFGFIADRELLIMLTNGPKSLQSLNDYKYGKNYIKFDPDKLCFDYAKPIKICFQKIAANLFFFFLFLFLLFCILFTVFAIIIHAKIAIVATGITGFVSSLAALWVIVGSIRGVYAAERLVDLHQRTNGHGKNINACTKLKECLRNLPSGRKKLKNKDKKS